MTAGRAGHALNPPSGRILELPSQVIARYRFVVLRTLQCRATITNSGRRFQADVAQVALAAAGERRTSRGPRTRTRDPAGADAGYGQVGISGQSFTEPGVSDDGHHNSTPVVGDSYDIVGWYDIDDVGHGFWAIFPAQHAAPRPYATNRASRHFDGALPRSCLKNAFKVFPGGLIGVLAHVALCTDGGPMFAWDSPTAPLPASARRGRHRA